MFRTTRPKSAFSSHDNRNDVGTGVNCRQEAALERSSRKLARHHPGVKLPPRLTEKSKLEQIQRSCDRFKSFPGAVDTLYRTLHMILSNPSNYKYRSIDRSNPGYQRSLANIPGAEQLLLSVNFVPSGRNMLILRTVDQQLLKTAMNCLESTKQTPEYTEAKRELEFGKLMNQVLAAKPSEAELGERKKLLFNCPREPDAGRGGPIYILIKDSKKTTTLQRRFDGDDTLQNVLDWLGGEAGTIFQQNLKTRQWSLVDTNRYPIDVPIDCESHANKTLQHLGFWPSGRLIVRPSTQKWKNRETSPLLTMGASRGLGSAPSEAL